LYQKQLSQYLDALLKPQALKDYCPNGLQVEGNGRPIQRLATAVTASLEAIEDAIALKADVLLVHHGLFWKGDCPTVVGPKRVRLALALEAGLAIYAYHLPLDIHPILGNNAQLAKHMGWHVSEFLDLPDLPGGLAVVRFVSPIPVGAIAEELTMRLNRTPVCLAAQPDVQTLAICTGAAQKFAQQVAELGADAYLTGELSEQSYHTATEYGLSIFGAGHHATERYGVQALGAHLAEEFGLYHQFLESDNPI
ncbi:MAG: Nif3-like dinuclear metal center hexameric protein, partial [Pseudomonadota bacterium]